jgi:hypothetical protein
MVMCRDDEGVCCLSIAGAHDQRRGYGLDVLGPAANFISP